MASKTAELFRNRIIGYGTKPADQFQANALNYRKHPQRQRDAVQASLRELGWIGVVVENQRTGNLVDGHERVWQALQHNEDVPYIEVDLSEEEERLALAVFDPITNMAETDAAILDDLLREVNTGEAALQALLAEMAEGAGLYAPKTEGDTAPQVDRAEELRQKWQTAAGQLWQLGEHRLIVGDCTDAATVARVMGGERADTLISDPPYGIGYEYADHDDSDNRQNEELIKRAWQLAPVGRVWTCGLMNLRRDLAWNPDAKVLCWHKGFAQAGNGLGGASTWEPVLVVGVKGGTLPDDYLHFGTDRIEGLRDLHSCPKPVALFEHLINHLAGAIVYEPFSGSGTTIIACENLGRKCRAVEISAAYCAVALQRWADHTQRTPVLLTD